MGSNPIGGTGVRRDTRHVDPQLLASTGGHWYLVAYCRLRDGVRWFRLDRIEKAAVTAEAAREVPLAEIGEPPASSSPVASLVQPNG